MSLSARTENLCKFLKISVPILLAPMAGVPAPALSCEVADAGGLGACGALLMEPQEIFEWALQVRDGGNRSFQINLWIPDAAPVRDPAHEKVLSRFLSKWGPEPSASAGDAKPPCFDAQCEALLEIKPTAISSVMGLFSSSFVDKMKEAKISWLATVSTLAEARKAEDAGADVIIVQGMEAGGHRAAFDPAKAERELVGLFALIPAVSDTVAVPVVASGGIADGRGIAAALLLGASAVQIGTGFLRCPEAKLSTAWADALGEAAPEDTMVSRVFSGRAGRSLVTDYVLAATADDAPSPAPYPVQRGLTAPMRKQATTDGDVQKMQAWAGQSAAMARPEPAATVLSRLWADARNCLESAGL